MSWDKETYLQAFLLIFQKSIMFLLTIFSDLLQRRNGICSFLYMFFSAAENYLLCKRPSDTAVATVKSHQVKIKSAPAFLRELILFSLVYFH